VSGRVGIGDGVSVPVWTYMDALKARCVSGTLSLFCQPNYAEINDKAGTTYTIT